MKTYKPYSESMQNAARSTASLEVLKLNKDESTQRHIMFDKGVGFADKEYKAEIEALQEENRLLKDKLSNYVNPEL